MQTSETYVESVLRTDTPVTPELIARHSNPNTIRLIHAVLGMVTESAELADMLKRHLFYGRSIDVVNGIEELGDNQWYVGLAIDVFKTSMNEVLTMNIEKLKLRYPEKFCENHAVKRNLEAERKLLETPVYKVPEEKISSVEEDQRLSQRAKDWIAFSELVLFHIESYTVPQYGDKGEDEVTSWTIQDCFKAIDKYKARYGKNSREGQQTLDFLKIAHFIQIAYNKHKENTL